LARHEGVNWMLTNLGGTNGLGLGSGRTAAT
jgi:hypothetical protein